LEGDGEVVGAEVGRAGCGAVLQGPAQAPQRVPEVAARVLFVAVRPEEAGELLAAVRDAGVQGEGGEQGLGRARGERDGLAIPADLELPEQPDFEHRGPPGPGPELAFTGRAAVLRGRDRRRGQVSQEGRLAAMLRRLRSAENTLNQRSLPR